jgi:hypothetical protein
LTFKKRSTYIPTRSGVVSIDRSEIGGSAVDGDRFLVWNSIKSLNLHPTKIDPKLVIDEDPQRGLVKLLTIGLLQSWINASEQQDTGHNLLKTLDKNRSSWCKKFAPKLEGVTWQKEFALDTSIRC